MSATAARFRVYGRVQGVGFRWWALQQARRLDLHGSVRNCEDGSVEIIAQGAPDALQRLRMSIISGPPGADVTHVDEDEAPPVEPEAFHIE